MPNFHIEETMPSLADLPVLNALITMLQLLVSFRYLRLDVVGIRDENEKSEMGKRLKSEDG